jgi:hypothetical protein
VVKSLGLIGAGPVGLIHTQEFRFQKNKRPTSVVESYKTTYGHKAVVLMSVVGERAENICSLRAFSVLTHNGHSDNEVGVELLLKVS